MAELRLRPWTKEVAKDRTALEIYANRKNWQRRNGKWVFIGPCPGPLVAQRALSTCLPGRSMIPTGRKRITKALTA